MKKVVTVSLVIVALSGCAIHQDLMNNNFVDVVPAAVPPSLVGTWTGTMGPNLVTLKILADGSGASCWSWSGRDALNKVKYDGQQLRIQDGSRLNVVSIAAAELVVHPPYFGASDYRFKRDEQLQEASLYCAKSM